MNRPYDMKLVYLAAPLSPVKSETRAGNLHRAKVIYEALSLKFTDCVFLAPWVMNAEVFEETETNRSIGMARNFAVIRKCDEIWLLGPRISSGMRSELNYAKRNGIAVKNLTTAPEALPPVLEVVS